MVSLRWAHERGFSEGLFMNSVGNLSEGTGTNVFVVINGQVVTPGLDSGCLAGITRELILDWGMAVEGELGSSDLENADEVFLTSSTRDVHPVLSLGDRQWEGAGEVSRALSAQYVRGITQDVDP